MRRCALIVLLCAAIGCGDPPPAPTVIQNTPAPPAPPPSSQRLVLFWMCCGNDSVGLGSSRQIEARATWSDGTITNVTALVTDWRSSNDQIAQISTDGVVTGKAAGATVLSASFQGTQTSWQFQVTQSFFRPPAPDELTGYVYESTPFGQLELTKVEAEYGGQKVTNPVGGFYRLSGLTTPGLDLVLRRRGFAPGRVTISRFGLELAPVVLEPDSSHVSEFIEERVCFPHVTITRSFRPTVNGVFSITNAWSSSTSRKLFGNGAVVSSWIYNNDVIELTAGVNYELQVTGACDYSGGILKMTYLRPR